MPTDRDADSAPMQLTGERTAPGIWHENYWFRRHEIAYLTLRDSLPPGRILEAGCGEGYGADLVRSSGSEVVGLDYDGYAVQHVRRRYPVLSVVQGNLVALPFANGSFDAVLSLQTIEHLWDQPAFVAECFRVLSPGGRVALTTPNRLTFPPGNAYHTRELTSGELAELVLPHATEVDLRGITHGSRLRAWEDVHGDLMKAQISQPPEVWPPELRQLVESVTAGDFVFTDDLAGCLDLFLVAKT